MPLKDHYRTLGVPHNATAEDVKKAFRKLAHQYHPDKNEDNPYAAARFMEAQQAYATLSDERLRRAYDEERFFAGMTAQREPQLLTVQWLVQQSASLKAYMQQVDSDRMNHSALSNYVQLLLSDAHLAVLLAEQDDYAVSKLTGNLLISVRRLHYPLLLPVIRKLQVVTERYPALKQQVEGWANMRRREYRIEKVMPLAVVGIAILLCTIMFFLARR